MLYESNTEKKEPYLQRVLNTINYYNKRKHLEQLSYSIELSKRLIFFFF